MDLSIEVCVTYLLFNILKQRVILKEVAIDFLKEDTIDILKELAIDFLKEDTIDILKEANIDLLKADIMDILPNVIFIIALTIVDNDDDDFNGDDGNLEFIFSFAGIFLQLD